MAMVSRLHARYTVSGCQSTKSRIGLGTGNAMSKNTYSFWVVRLMFSNAGTTMILSLISKNVAIAGA
jgi:hypothetical protein